MADRVIWCDRGWQPVIYGFCPSEKAWTREMKKMGITDEPFPDTDGRVTFFTKEGKTTAIMTMRDGAEKERTLIEVIGLVVHEATHIWQEILIQIGEKSPGQEMEAYSIQAITQELLWAFNHSRGLPSK